MRRKRSAFRARKTRPRDVFAAAVLEPRIVILQKRADDRLPLFSGPLPEPLVEQDVPDRVAPHYGEW